MCWRSDSYGFAFLRVAFRFTALLSVRPGVTTCSPSRLKLTDVTGAKVVRFLVIFMLSHSRHRFARGSMPVPF